MKLVGLLCINILVVNFIVALSLDDTRESKIERIVSLNYEDQKFQVVSKLGNPVLKNGQKWHYRYNALDSIIISWQENRLAFVHASFSRPISLDGFQVADKVILLESHNSWAKVGIPAKGQLFELNARGKVLSFEIRKPWLSQEKKHYLSSLLIELGLVPKMVMRESNN